MAALEVIILGAGPCGLATSIALAKLSAESYSNPIHITLVELRPKLQTIGGSISLTPLAMRYLDDLGAGARVRANAVCLDDGVDFVSLRSGRRIGNIWGNIGAVRVKRQDLVESLLKTLVETHSETVDIEWGQRAVDITEQNEKVHVKFADGTQLSGDLLLGCDGLHSVARRQYVEPGRSIIYTGRAAAIGWGETIRGDADGKPDLPLRLSNGESALRDAAVVVVPDGIVGIMYYEPTRTKICYIRSMVAKEPEGSDVRDGWKLRGDDKEAVRNEIIDTCKDGRIDNLSEYIARCDSWDLYPVYVLPAEGQWVRGRVLLMGDAAHAMPPQGESTGFALEDAVLFAHVCRRRQTREVHQLLSDFATTRKPAINQHYKAATALWERSVAQKTWFTSAFQEWGLWAVLLYKRCYQESQFAGDIRDIRLPD